MIKYRYILGNQKIETLDISSIPDGLEYETIEFDHEESIREEEARKLEKEWSIVRQTRNQLLAECDWTQLSDNSLTIEQKQSYQEYRQALRDITLQTDPFNIVYPEKPQEVGK